MSRRRPEPPADLPPDPSVRYELTGPPGDDLAVAVHRAALTVLRAELATVWLDPVPAGDGWPAAAVEPAGRLARRPNDPRGPRRPGRRADTAVLDPALDEDFELGVALAPFTATVEAMSRRGRVVLARRDGEPQLRLRLDPGQFRSVVEAVPGTARRLRRFAPPRSADPSGRPPERAAPYGPMAAAGGGASLAWWAVAALLAVTTFVLPSVGTVRTALPADDVVWSLLRLAAGGFFAVQGLHVALRAVHWRYPGLRLLLGRPDRTPR